MWTIFQYLLWFMPLARGNCNLSFTTFHWPNVSITQPFKLDLNKKSFPKQKTIQIFTIDAQGFRKNKKWKSSHMGNRSYQLTSAGWSAHGWQIDWHWLGGNSHHFLRGRIFIFCFSEPLGINSEVLNSLLLGGHSITTWTRGRGEGGSQMSTLLHEPY